MVGTFLTFLLMLVVAPENTEAGCARHRNAELDQLTDLASLNFRGDRTYGAVEDSDESPTNPVGPQPCSGPSCSKNPASPAGPSKLVLERVIRQWADLINLGEPIEHSSRLIPLPAPPIEPTLAVTSILRPPRPGA